MTISGFCCGLSKYCCDVLPLDITFCDDDCFKLNIITHIIYYPIGCPCAMFCCALSIISIPLDILTCCTLVRSPDKIKDHNDDLKARISKCDEPERQKMLEFEYLQETVELLDWSTGFKRRSLSGHLSESLCGFYEHGEKVSVIRSRLETNITKTLTHG